MVNTYAQPMQYISLIFMLLGVVFQRLCSASMAEYILMTIVDGGVQEA